MVSDANEVSLLGRKRDRFKAAGVAHFWCWRQRSAVSGCCFG